MSVYLFVLLMILFLGMTMAGPKASLSNRKAYVIIIALVLFALGAVRSFKVGVDTLQFCEAYVRIGREGVAAFGLERYEYLFTALCLALNKISSNYQLLIVVSSALCTLPIAYLIYHGSENVVLSFFLYVTLNMFFSSMNTMRQSMAIGVLAIGLVWLMKDKTWPFVVTVLIAFLFHRSAIVALALLLVRKRDFNTKTFVIYLVGILFVFVFSEPIMKAITAVYGRETLYTEEFMGSNYYGAFINASVAFVCCILCVNYFSLARRMCKDSPQDALFMHGMMLWLLFAVFKMRVEIVGRLMYYFMPFAILAIPTALKHIPGVERRIVTMTVCVCFFIYFMVTGVARPEWYGVIPYQADLRNVLSIV